MLRSIIPIVLVVLVAATSTAQSVSVYQTTPDLREGLSRQTTLHFSAQSPNGKAIPLIAVDDTQKFQQIDGFGAAFTDTTAWLFAQKLTPEQVKLTFKSLFERKDGIALSILRQPIGSSDLAVTFYSNDDLCEQAEKPCVTPEGRSDPHLEHFSLKHDEEYILPELRQILAINPDMHIMITPFSPPGWMKSSGSVLGSMGDTKPPSNLKTEFYPAFAGYLVKTIEGYQAAGIPVWALSVQNEPLAAPSTYNGMLMLADEQAKFIGENLGPALAVAHLHTKIMAYDHNWDRPDYPETVLKDAKASMFVAGTAWHHYGGDPSVMTKIHEEFPQKDQWTTEAGGGAWQKGYGGNGNILAEEAAELIGAMRNWSRTYMAWTLATDQDHGPHLGGCDVCRGLVTIHTSNPKNPVTRELDYYVLGHASKFVYPGAVRIASDEPPGTAIKDVAFLNVDGTIVLYLLNAGTNSSPLAVGFHGKRIFATIPGGALATFVWKP